MKTPLRSLSGLLDFEAAARWNSFKLAAHELHKTPAAISQQIKQLEQELGFALFIRYPRHIVMTEKGQELAVTVARTLAELRNKVTALQSRDEESVLRISTTHSLAIKWLVPRMGRFTLQFPELDMRIDSSDKLVDLNDDSTDLAIRYGAAHEGDPAVLFREQRVAVYSPRLLKPGQATLTLADLATLPLLYEESTGGWLKFLNENRMLGPRYDFSRGYTHGGVLAQAAAAGQGVALAAYGIVYDDIQSGTLMMLAARSVPSQNGYRFLVNPRKESMAKVQRFHAWLREEMAQMRRTLEQATRE